MKNIKLLNKIAKVGLDRLDPAEYTCGTEIENPDAILVRSASMHEMTFEDNLLAIARAGAGVNNIPIDACTEKGIVVFNTPGANANGVKELTVCALLLAARKITDGANWAQSLEGDDVAAQVEKGKSQFAGTELLGKTLGVIGLGAIGGMVANVATALGMKVVGCDPFLSVDGAWNMNPAVKRVATFEDIFKTCDYITLHVPATPQTKKMINADTLAMMKDGVKIINLARADLVDAAAMCAAVDAGKVSAYVTDFPIPEILGHKGIVTIPHLGASTEESEDNCAVMAADELNDYLTLGNIRNSVNYPSVALPYSGAPRVCVLHANAPEALSKITGVLADKGISTVNVLDKAKGDNAYTILELSAAPDDAAVAALKAIDGVARVRVI